MSHYPSGFDVVTELFLVKEHTSIEHMSPGVVKGDNVVLLDHVKRSYVERYPRYKRHISQGHFDILIAMHYHINAAENLYLHFSAITNDQVFFRRGQGTSDCKRKTSHQCSELMQRYLQS